MSHYTYTLRNSHVRFAVIKSYYIYFTQCSTLSWKSLAGKPEVDILF